MAARPKIASYQSPVVAACAGLIASVCLYVWVYSPRAATSIQESDGAEFLLSSLEGSLVHPPGYPLYTAVGYVWARLFPCNVYHSLALFSSLSQAAAAGILLIVLSYLSGSLVVAASLAIGWALLEPSIRVAADAEVFAFHHLLTVLLVASVLWRSRSLHSPRIAAYAIGVALGLAIAHQHLVVLLFPFVLGLWFENKGRANTNDAAIVIGTAAVTALVLYASLFIRYWHAPELAFAPLASGVDFLSYVLRAGYGTFSLFLSDGGDTRSFAPEVGWLLLSGLPAALVLAFALLKAGLRGRSALWWGALGTTLLTLLFVRGLELPLPAESLTEWMMRFYSTVALSVVFAAAVGFSYLNRGRAVGAFIVGALTLTGLWLRLPEGLRQSDASSDHAVEDEVHETIMTAPENAVLLVGSDRLVFGLNLKQKAQSLRPDLLVVALGMLESDFYRRRVAAAFGAGKGFDSESLREPRMLAVLARSKERVLLAEPQIPVPDGLFAQRWGILNHWSEGDVDFGAQRNAIFTLCSRAPTALRDTPQSRRRSQEILDQAFLAPLRTFRQQASAQDQRELDAVLSLLTKGDLEEARARCADVLSESNA